MRTHRRGLLSAFWENHPDAERSLRAWFQEANKADWNSPAELKAQYRHASILKGGRVVFNICGNKYRLVTRIDFQAKIVVVRWIGAHAAYDTIDAETV